MNRKLFVLASIFLLMLTACSEKTEQNHEKQRVENLTKIEVIGSEDTETKEKKEVLVNGPYGSIQVSIPFTWEARVLEAGNENLLATSYGIQFYPVGDESEYVEVGYTPQFGVCGTGLEEKETEIAGVRTNIGYYDGNENWSFMIFDDAMEHIVAINNQKNCSEENQAEVISILNTLVFDSSDMSGAIGVMQWDEEMDRLGIEARVDKVDQITARISIYAYDYLVEECKINDEAVVLEKKENDQWKKLECNISAACSSNVIKSGEKAVIDTSWGETYDELSAGDYRIEIPVKVIIGHEAKQNVARAYFIVR